MAGERAAPRSSRPPGPARPGTGDRLAGLPDTTSRRGLLIGLATGLPVIAYGLRGVLVDADDTHPAELARWVVGAALVHDVVLAPAVLAVGWALSKVVPPSAWRPVRWGLMTTGLLALVAWPLVRGYGEDPTIPSLLPRDYASGLATGVAAVWLAAAAWFAVVRRSSQHPPSGHAS